MTQHVKIFAGTASNSLGERIASSYGTELGKMSVLRFSDGEFAITYEETVRGDAVFLVQSTIPPADNLMELLLMVDAAKRASAKEIIAVVPYLGLCKAR